MNENSTALRRSRNRRHRATLQGKHCVTQQPPSLLAVFSRGSAGRASSGTLVVPFDKGWPVICNRTYESSTQYFFS